MRTIFIKILSTSLFFSTTIPAALFPVKSIKRPLTSLLSRKIVPSALFSTNAKDTKTDDTKCLLEKIKMPNAYVLQSLLSEHGFDDFAKKTNIVSLLANQKKFPQGIVTTVALSCFDYNKKLQKLPDEKQIKMLIKQIKPELFKLLFQDKPEALEVLKKHGLLN